MLSSHVIPVAFPKVRIECFSLPPLAGVGLDRKHKEHEMRFPCSSEMSNHTVIRWDHNNVNDDPTTISRFSRYGMAAELSRILVCFFLFSFLNSRDYFCCCCINI